jgi:steroid 5-alpha reductase family enzyme
LIALVIAVFLALAMAGAWAVAIRSGLSGRADAIWTFATGLACLGALAAGAVEPARAAIPAVYLLIWTGRLGYYLWRRAAHGDDPRYAEMKREWGDKASSRMFGFLQIQAVASWPMAISAYVAAGSPREAPDLRDALAALVFIAALVGEGVADRQMAAFKADPANKGGVCQSGLWAWSRHPNYFFEWLGWLGFPLLALQADYWPGLLSLLAPAWMYVLLVYVSGVPPLEKTMRASRGAAWEGYVARVSAFWPLPPKRA